jgi:Uma2 family endonuclease
MTPVVAIAELPAKPKLLTAEEFIEQYPDHRVELIRGVVTEMSMPGSRHGKVSARVVNLLLIHVDAHDLGHVMSNDTFVLVGRNPDTVFGADVFFISYERQPKGDVPAGLTLQPPELVVEVKSPTDLWTDLVAKAEDYLAGGVLVVVLIDPEKKGLIVSRKDAQPLTLGEDDRLSLDDVLPGFSVAVRRLFA